MDLNNIRADASPSVEIVTKSEESATKIVEESPFLTHPLTQIRKEQKKFRTFRPREWLNGFRPNSMYPLFVKGDIDAFVVLFINNLATLLVIVISAKSILGDDIVYSRMVPGMSFGMLWGNFYYVYMARKIAFKERRGDVCVMPYGISTVGAFAFIYAIVLPAYSHCILTNEKDYCRELAYYVGLASNFVQGIILLSLCVVGELIRRNTPRIALLSSLSALGYAYLAMNECLPVMATPIVSFVPFFIVMVGYFGEVSFGPVPIVLVALGIGTALGWGTSLNSVEQVRNAYKLVKRYPVIFPAKKMFENIREILPYISTTIPAAIANAIATIQCVESARQAGDFYPTNEAMFADGIGTLISSFFGSILSMTTYIGHPAMKKMGAKQGYSLLNGIAFVPLCFLGFSAFIMSLITIVSVNPIIIFIGLLICADTLADTPRRHYPAFLFGLMPAIAEWTKNTIVTGVSAGYSNFTIANVQFIANVSSVISTFSYRGMINFSGGSLLQCIFVTAILIYTIDRKFIRATVWTLFASSLSIFGIIHADSVGILIKRGDDGWRFSVAYLMLAVLFGIFHFAQRRNWIKAPIAEVDEFSTEE